MEDISNNNTLEMMDMENLQRQHLFESLQMTPGPAGDWGIGILEEGREEILEWREKRLKRQARQKSFHGFTVYSFNLKTLNTFIHNFNYMVIFHMALAGSAVYLAKRFNLSFDIQLSLLISPIVFPLAFAINADFQRRDTVLEYIAHFESSGMVLYMCLREWRKDTGLNHEWISQVHDKLKSILFLLREYLFTNEDTNRKFILRAIYEDFSDTNQMIEQMRTSKLQPNGPLMSRAIHLLSLMCLAFERLRVVKEYRSPRSIRAFNKVLIMLLPLIMAPYFVFLGKKSENEWSPYFISVVMAFVFSALQGVQDKLDDPFDGMGEDDIKLNAIDEWTFDSFETTVQRFHVGRFNVSVEKNDFPEKIFSRRKNSYASSQRSSLPFHGSGRKISENKRFSTNSIASVDSSRKELRRLSSDPATHPYRDVLENMKPNTCIKSSSKLRRQHSELDNNPRIADLAGATTQFPHSVSLDQKLINRESKDSLALKPGILENSSFQYLSSTTLSTPLEDVSFQYPNNEKSKIIKDHNLANEKEECTGRTNIITVAENIGNLPTQEDSLTELPSSNENDCNSTEKNVDVSLDKSRTKSIDHDETDELSNSLNVGSYLFGEKSPNSIKKCFRISPIHEEPELFMETIDKKYSILSLSNGNIPKDCNIIPASHEKGLPPITPQNAFNRSPNQKKKSLIPPVIVKNPNKIFCVNSTENNGHNLHNASQNDREKRRSTELDISLEIDNTSSNTLAKEKFKLLHIETDFQQSKDVHSRLS